MPRDKEEDTKMTQFRRCALVIAASALPCGIALADVDTPAASAASDAAVTPAQVVQSLEDTFGVHPGRRRNHIKGTCALGEFVGTPAAAVMTRSEQFSGKSIPVVARFSVAGGNPNVADATRNARGMALEFRLPSGALQHMTMLNAPVFGAAYPATFNAMILASRPDPSTGKPDPIRLRDFLAAHPDALAQSSYLSTHNPPTSYANSAYFSIHTFKFLDSHGGSHNVKWRFIPRDGEKTLTTAEIAGAPHDFLEQRLIDQVSKRPIQWEMIVYVGEPGDPEDNPTLTWPETRRHFTAGTLTISKAMSEHGAECEKINFDPLIMSDGLAPTNDPVLLFRSPSYAISFARRLSSQ
jgi:catalase